MSLRKFVREVHRRSLWQVLGIYVLGSWGVLQVVDVMSSHVALPPWTFAFTFVLLLVGLPIVLATAFVQEGREAPPVDAGPDPVRELPATASQSLLTWRNAALCGVAALALWGVVAAGWLLFTGDPAAAAGGGEFRSIAVLPFATRSEDQQDRYFAEGMHDDLLTQLAKIDSLTVISRTSVMQYADTKKSIRSIGQELGVAVVLEGGIQRAGDHVRVNVQLIDANTDRHLWAETYDEELTAANVFAIQSDLARKIAGALRGTLSPALAKRIEARPTESLEAYDLYNRGRYALQHRGIFGEDLDGTRVLFEQAIAHDSSFAAAWVGLALVEYGTVNWQRVAPAVGLPRARALLDRALTLDPDNAEGLAAKARMLVFEGQLEEGERDILRALELGPGNAEFHAIHGGILESLGRNREAILVTQRAIQLDPRNVNYRHLLTDRYFFSGDFETAILEGAKAVQMAPGEWYGYYNLGWAHAAAGQSAPAIKAFRNAFERTTENASTVQLGLAYAFARASQRDSALAYLEKIDHLQAGYDYALVLYELNDHDRAFEFLEIALRNEPGSVRRIARDPTAEALRSDPRYGALVRRLNGP